MRQAVDVHSGFRHQPQRLEPKWRQNDGWEPPAIRGSDFDMVKKVKCSWIPCAIVILMHLISESGKGREGRRDANLCIK